MICIILVTVFFTVNAKSALKSNTSLVARNQQSSASVVSRKPPVLGTSRVSSESNTSSYEKWSGSLVAQSYISNESIQRIGNSNVSTINYLGLGYKVTRDTKLGLRQYGSYETDPARSNYLMQSWTTLTLTTKTAGIAGSDAIAPMFWYYVPLAKSVQNSLNTDDTVAHAGILRIDAEIAWTLSPKWTVSYYINPRQSLVSESYFIDRSKKEKHVFALSSLYHYGYVYYNINSSIQFYGYAGMVNRLSTADLTSFEDHALMGIGASLTLFNGVLILNPEIYNEVGLKDNFEYAAAPRWLQSEDMTYSMTASICF